MSKTMMVSDLAYEKLKKIKEREDASFSEVILNLVESNESKKVGNLKIFFGVLKGDKEYDRVLREIKSGWSVWTKKYA
ncbi:MAG: antitoxin VapB family protein [Candidatus Diapherotrites archaeon]|nr:antitoxin VapB family protein [Candidatus Diapherotrites archaeon]